MPYYRVILNDLGGPQYKLERQPEGHVTTTSHMIYLEGYNCPEIYIFSPLIEVCSGVSVTVYSAIYGTIYAGYQWFLNNVELPGETNANLTYVPSNGDEVYCTLSGDTCGIRTSNTVTFIVDSLCTPSIIISYRVLIGDGTYQQSKSTICSGNTIIFSGNTTCGGTNPKFSWWKKNGLSSWSVVHGATSLTYSYKPTDNDQIKCEMTSNEKCISISAVTSNIIGPLNVNPLMPVSITVSPTGVTACSGTSVTYTATGVNAGTSSTPYRWYVNDILKQTGTGTTYTYIPLNNDLVKCTLTSNLDCKTGSPATSNIVTNSISDVEHVEIEIESNPRSSAGQVNVNSGQGILFYVVRAQGHCGDPTYQWYLYPPTGPPAVPVGSNSSAYTLIDPLTDNSVYCELTSGCACDDGPVNSNGITVALNAVTGKTVTIISDDNNVCSGHTVNFSANTYGFIPTPTYQWKLNPISDPGWINVGSNNSYYSYNGFFNGDEIICVVTQGGDYNSNTITMVVYPQVTPYITITVSDNPICSQTQIYFYTQIVQNVGLNPTWQWYINYYEVGTWETIGYNQQSFQPILGSINANDQVKLRVTCTPSDGYCPSPTYDESNIIDMVVNPMLVPSVIISTNQRLCTYSAITFTAEGTNIGTGNYEWYTNEGLQYTGTYLQTTWTHTFTTVTSVYCIMTSNITCRTADEAISNTIDVITCPEECLKNLMVEIYYRMNWDQPGGVITPGEPYINGAQLNYEPASNQGHGCYRAQYQVILNYGLANELAIGSTVTHQGLCNLNNYDHLSYPHNNVGAYIETDAPLTAHIDDYFAPISTHWMGPSASWDVNCAYKELYCGSRYWYYTISDTQAATLVNSDGTFNLYINYLGNPGDPPSGEHSEMALVRFTKITDSGNTLKYRGFIKSYNKGYGYKVDPCTGNVVEFTV